MTEGNCEGIGFGYILSASKVSEATRQNPTILKQEMISRSRWCPGCPAYYKVEPNPKYRCYPVVLYDQAPNRDYNVSITPTI